MTVWLRALVLLSALCNSGCEACAFGGHIATASTRFKPSVPARRPRARICDRSSCTAESVVPPCSDGEVQAERACSTKTGEISVRLVIRPTGYVTCEFPPHRIEVTADNCEPATVRFDDLRYPRDHRDVSVLLRCW